MDCIPAGMEMFPASDEEQFEFIKRVIDDCDYYLLIIGGRYGSVTSEGISYTEKEYDYAVEKGLKVVALLHRDPDSIPVGKSESTSEERAKLAAFRDKVSKGRLVDYWDSAAALPGLVALSMMNAIKTFPGVGWVRANRIISDNFLERFHLLTGERDSLKLKLDTVLSTPEISDLAPLETSFIVFGTARRVQRWMPSGRKTLDERADWDKKTTWEKIFLLISPYLTDFKSETAVKTSFESSIEDENYQSVIVHDQNFKTIRIQLEAHKLIEVQHNKSSAK